MSNIISLTQKQQDSLFECKKPAEVIDIAEKLGMNINEKQAEDALEWMTLYKSYKNGELSDDQLDLVAGGTSYDMGSNPLLDFFNTLFGGLFGNGGSSASGGSKSSARILL